MKKDKLPKTLQENLKRWRKEIDGCGITLSEFCRLYDIPRITIYTLRNPTMETLDRIEDAVVDMKSKYLKSNA